MNLWAITGNLGRDAEVRQAGNSTVCGFSVAVKSGFGDKAQTNWVSCSIWGKQAEGALPGYLKKGQQVAVTGELSTREYEGKTYLELRVNSIDLVGSKGDNSAPQVTPPSQPMQQQQQQPQQAYAPQQQAAPSFGFGAEDNIPFNQAPF